MDWHEVVEHPSLKNLPFKIETNKWGKIMMAPASFLHGIYQGRISKTLGNLAEEGEIAVECPVQTSEGVRVPDVAWGSNAFLKKHGIRNIKLPEAPEVVVEIVSPSNTVAELEEKKQLYFDAGAREFWICDEEGNMRFFNHRGELKRSEIFAEFPERIEIGVS